MDHSLSTPIACKTWFCSVEKRNIERDKESKVTMAIRKLLLKPIDPYPFLLSEAASLAKNPQVLKYLKSICKVHRNAIKLCLVVNFDPTQALEKRDAPAGEKPEAVGIRPRRRKQYCT
ncbi:unnamed protein product [Cochlearia groenlandica]